LDRSRDRLTSHVPERPGGNPGWLRSQDGPDRHLRLLGDDATVC
jgi:hypothetical protein